MAITQAIIAQIAEIEREAFSEPWNEKSLTDTLSYDYNRVFLEFSEDGISGYLIANLIAEESELLRIAVKKKKKRQGIANRLMQAYMESMKKDCTRFLLEVRIGNEAAKSLYQKYGYTEIATRKAYYHNPVEDAVIYECNIE